jgi:hypothetical protein
MTIEAGKKYRTRDGSEALVLAEVPKPSACRERWVGFINHPHGWDYTSWFDGGNYAPTDSFMSCGEDLVEPIP